MRKQFLLLSLFLCYSICFAQTINGENLNAKYILKQMYELDQSLLTKDTAKLNQILHQKLTLGHSNGWVESKISLLSSLPSSKVDYRTMKSIQEPVVEIIQENLASSRRKVHVVGTYENEDFVMNLEILEIWIKENDIWQLVARQSVEINDEE